MFKTRKTLEIEYDPTQQQLVHLEEAAKLVGNLVEILEKEEEEVAYFMDNEYSIDFIKNLFYFLHDMAEERYNSNILEQ